jgi:hypothetical protein
VHVEGVAELSHQKGVRKSKEAIAQDVWWLSNILMGSQYLMPSLP